MLLYHFLIQPFADYAFMRRALVACIALALGGTPLGVFLVLRRMTLAGDAISHAILPGVSIAFLVAGASLWPMTVGGVAAGLLVALFAGAVSRATPLKEDASFMGAYLISLALGVLLISLRGGMVDLMHILFGNVLAVDNASLTLIASVASASLLLFMLVYRVLIVECFNPGFLRTVTRGGGRSGVLAHQLFLVLMVLNLVCAFQALGTMMALGLMVLPAIATRFWTLDIDRMIPLGMALAAASGYAGLLVSYHANTPSGPAIVLTAGAVYLVSLVFGRHGSFAARLRHPKHFAG